MDMEDEITILKTQSESSISHCALTKILENNMKHHEKLSLDNDVHFLMSNVTFTSSDDATFNCRSTDVHYLSSFQCTDSSCKSTKFLLPITSSESHFNSDITCYNIDDNLSDTTHSSDELVHPDLHSLFLIYNDSHFYGKLEAVEVKWSKRMTLCAGLCVYHKGGYCSIRLSEPLLKYRTVKEFKETLLHEMIHAYLFVTENNRDHDSHGEEFQSHMRRLNSKLNLSISIYHNFHEEVDYYRQHVWRCRGICRFKPPYYGFIRRAMNRKPSQLDFWWSRHQRECGGIFEKVAEPLNKEYRKKRRNEEISLNKKPARLPIGQKNLNCFFLKKKID